MSGINGVTPRVYIAGPIGRTAKIHDNVLDGIHAAQRVRDLGFMPFLPHLFFCWHIIYNREDWLDLDLEWLECCHGLLRLPGDSPGADREVDRAHQLGIPVFESVEELASWGGRVTNPKDHDGFHEMVPIEKPKETIQFCDGPVKSEHRCVLERGHLGTHVPVAVYRASELDLPIDLMDLDIDLLNPETWCEGSGEELPMTDRSFGLCQWCEYSFYMAGSRYLPFHTTTGNLIVDLETLEATARGSGR